MRLLLFALGFLLLIPAVQAQYELKAGTFNSTFVAQTASGTAATASGPPVVASPAPTSEQFRSVGQLSGGAGAIDSTPDNAGDSGTIASVHGDRYPSTSTNAFVLVRASIGGMFASGLPRYSMGDEITPPLVTAGGLAFTSSQIDSAARDAEILSKARAYWNFRPVQPGDSINPVALPVTVLASSTSSSSVTVSSVPASLVASSALLGRTVSSISGTTVFLNGTANETITSATTRTYVPSTPQVLLPKVNITVTSAATNSTTVQVASDPVALGLKLGDTLLGQPVSRILGNTLTLAGNANTTITSASVQSFFPATSYYYSPHSEKVYASQPGRVTITWITRVPNSAGSYDVLSEEFAVASTTTRETRTIYWTEGSFDAPKVLITDARISTVNPAYYTLVPKAVDQEVVIPGSTPATPTLTTLSFDKFNGIGQLHAYNVEGRILIEYLGNVRDVGEVYQSLGTDVVNLVRSPPVSTPTVNLGDEITPHDGDTTLTPSPVLSTAQNAASYYGTVVRSNNTAAYYAEQETGPPKNPDDGVPFSTDAYNKVVFYWLEEADFGIKWPKFQDRYWLRWSPDLTDYAHYTVDADGSTPATGMPFTGSVLPQIVYQDDPAQAEAQIDLATQRLFVRFDPTNKKQRNRSLLKFTSAAKVWYVNIYTQGEGRSFSLASSAVGTTTYTKADGTTAQGTLLNVSSSDTTKNLEAGMVVTGPGISGVATVLRVISATQLEVSQSLPLNLQPATVFNGTATQSSTLTTPSNFSANLALDGNFTNFTHTDGSNAPTFWQMTWAADRAVSKVTMYNRAGFEDRLRDITVSVMAADNTTVLWSSPLVNPGNSFGGPATIEVNVASLNGGAPVNGRAVKISRTVPVNGDPNVLSLAEVVVLSSPALTAASTFAYSVQADSLVPIDDEVVVGSRLKPPADHEEAGYISGGKGYYPAGYLNPFTVGVAAANLGAIIPVNARPTDKVLTVRWFKKISAPSADFTDLYVPGKWGRYRVKYPSSTTPQIVIAQGVGTNNLLGAEKNGSVYYQNNSEEAGYNPNEEHALMIADGTTARAYALRDDLNVLSDPGYTSEAFVLVAYTDTDKRPSIHAYQVLSTNATYTFDYTATAGTLLVKPYPLPLMPLAMVGTGVNRIAKDLETLVTDAPANGTVSGIDAYKKFTFQDRKGFTWVHRGPHNGGSPTLSMKLYYLSQPGFWIPGTGVPATGTVLPFLRNTGRQNQILTITTIDNGQIDEPRTIVYRPAWPANAPSLQVGETLTLPKFGLPQVRGQKSAQVYYEQSIAKASTGTGLSKSSVTLHDPSREKTVLLSALPSAIKTTSSQGRTYFQTLPPHLQQRIYFDPLRGVGGTLVFLGTFHDVAAGEDYVDLNVLTDAEEALIKGLVPGGSVGKYDWDNAINALNTRVETFKPDPAQFGSYIVDSTKNQDVGENDLASITDANTAVDSYAVTASGHGDGYVTMVFGNGNAFTPEGDPVQVQVFRIANQFYTGDLKVITSSNPLDEQVTLRHSGDFAAKPAEYEFEWRWATGAASAPLTYSSTMTPRIGAAGTPNWKMVSDPGATVPTAAQITAATAVPFTPARTVNVRPVNYESDAQNQPTTSVISSTSYTDAEIAAGFPALYLRSTTTLDFSSGVPGSIVFSATLGSHDGFVLYVNGRAVLAHEAPTAYFTSTAATTGLTQTGLGKQFVLQSRDFVQGANTIDVAIYTTADANANSSLSFLLEAANETDLVDPAITPASQWQPSGDTTGKNTNVALVGGSVSNPFGGPQFVLNDRWFTVRYRPTADAGNVLGTSWSRWTPPQFVEGWVKRVLAAINPFEQRVKDLGSNQVSTDVSVITQAGTRWEGDVALTLDSINDTGLIAIYETVLNRARNMSINANTNDPDSNNALLLAAGYLNDLYTILGNEAYADGANPTISIDDQSSITEVNTSRFSFEGQVASSLDEELALLRGRDDRTTAVNVAPAYNRLYWNYTHGINSGEAVYAINYNIKEKVGSSTADGVIDESDAQRMFPQGHGDAYGHYLTALTGYYTLISNPNFTWTPRAEAVTVLGQPVTVDFQDERKFAAAAGNVARTAQQVIALTYRQSYNDDPASGWNHYRDNTGLNEATGEVSHQGLDEWVSRSAQGALFHWAVANALVPDQDTVHAGVQKIDRTTVPEISELADLATTFQTTIDNANAHLNPLGLSPDAIAFDLSPAELKAGNSHFEQISSRSLRSLLNASGAFNQAAAMTRSLRDQQNQLDDYNTTIVQQENAYVNQLVDIYGKPYSGEIGAGKLYDQAYVGPDLYHWYIVDRPNDLVSTGDTFSITINEAVGLSDFTGSALSDLTKNFKAPDTVSRTITVQPSQWVQYNDVWKTGGLGSRAMTGRLQTALQDAQQSWLALSEASTRYQRENVTVERLLEVLADAVSTHAAIQTARGESNAEIIKLENVVLSLQKEAKTKKTESQSSSEKGGVLAEYLPKVSGLAADVTSSQRGALMNTAEGLTKLLGLGSVVEEASAESTRIKIQKEGLDLATMVEGLGFSLEEVQLAYELENAYLGRDTHAAELMQLTLSHQQSLQNVSNVLSLGLRILAEREVFRQRAAAIIQGYRTKDLGFRIFRNEALEQYRSLFDLASRYTYLAAKSYDYETGLLGTAAGRAVFAKIVSSRALGDLTGGVPQSTTSTLGDAGLAGMLARLMADFSVAEGRLGINNPDQYGTVFSLRGELFRIRTDSTVVADDDAWQQTLEQHMVANLLADADVATYCRNIKKPDGTAVPGIIIPFSTTIQHAKNFFGLDYLPGDHNYTPSNYATKIYSVGIALPGYVGMDAYAAGSMSSGAPASSGANALGATPYAYLVPCARDYMLAPPLGDTNILRSWNVHDQALPLPYNLGASDFNSIQFFNANGTLSEQPWILRKHQAFRMVSDPSFFYSSVPAEFTNNRLVGRSVWNGLWKIVIPAYTLHSDEQEGLNRFAASVRDIQLFLRTYSHSGN